MEAYANVVGGALKLKGKVGKKRKLKKRDDPERKDTDRHEDEAAADDVRDQADVHLTKAERELLRVHERNAKKAADKVKDKSYRERIADMNEHLANLSEHHDVPRVTKH